MLGTSNKATISQLKRHNEALVLREIYACDEISRVNIAERTHLSRPSVTEITQGLLQRGLITEVGPESRTSVGKKPTLLALNPNAFELITITINDDLITGARLNLRVEMLEQVSQPVSGEVRSELVEHIARVIECLRQHAQYPILGIGIATPGIVNPDTGLVLLASNLEWRDFPLGEMMRSRFHLPVYVDNDTNLITLGLHRFGISEGCNDVIVVKLGTGMGGGILSNGRIIHGNNYYAGELGHSSFLMLNDVCLCGRRGCLETLVSWWGLRRHAAALVAQYPDSILAGTVGGNELTNEHLLIALNQHDPHIEALVDQVAAYLGQALTIMIHMVNPRQIILTGTLITLGDRFLNQVQATIRERVFPYMLENVEIIVSPDEDRAIMLGAGAMLLEHELDL
jgi:predicted NBD/HSP70 family sugar kinase